MLTAAHENHALYGVVVLLESENSQPRRMPNLHVADVLDAHRRAIRAAHHDLAYILRISQKTESAHVVELLPYRIEAAAGIGVVRRERRDHLRHRDVEIVETGRIEQHLVLHRRAAKAGIVGYARHAAVSTLNHPILKGLQFLRRAVRAFEHIAVHQAAGTEERRHAGGHATGKRSVGDPLKRQLPREIAVRAFIEGQDDVGKAVQRDGTHHLKIGGAVHRQFERERGQALHLLGGVARPLCDELDHGRRKIRIGIHRHPLKGKNTGHDQKHYQNQ